MKKLTFTINFTLLFVSAILLTNLASAQTLHEVTVSSNVFEPDALTIAVGDTVRWTNVGGSHNVNGTMATFPNNPEDFGNEVGTGWVYTFVFSMTGNYEYHCNPHASLGMDGTISVSPASGIYDNISSREVVKAVYPTPATDYVIIELAPEVLTEQAQIFVFDAAGKEICKINNIQSTQTRIDTKRWPQGTYLFQIIDNLELLETGKIVK